jgi:hydrogenase maturation protease
MKNGAVVILGIGCTLFGDQGFGVHLVHELDRRFEFSDRVLLVDGGTIGVHLVGTLAGAEQVIAIDIVRRGGAPGTLYRLDGKQIIARLKGADHVLQEAFIEALIHCRMLDDTPRALLLGVEPVDAQAMACGLTPVLAAKVEEMIGWVLLELDGLGVEYRKK